MTLSCRAKLEMLSLLEQWKKQLGGESRLRGRQVQN